MSIAAAVSSSELWIATAMAGIALVAMVLIGAFRARSIDGPAAIVDRTEAPTIWMIAVIGFTVWQLSPLLVTVFMPRTPSGDVASSSAPATNPLGRSFTERQTVALSMAGRIAGIAAFVLADARLLRNGISRLGYHIRKLASAVLVSIPGSVIAILLTIAATAFTRWIWELARMPAEEHEMLKILREAPQTQLRIAVYFSAIVLAPLIEEIFFRGHLQTAIRVLTGWRWFSVIIVSLAFVAVHPAVWMMPPLMVLSICIGYAYERTGNLWVPILMHAAFNATSIVLSGMSGSR